MPDPSIFTSVIYSYLPEPHASLLNGILFGVNLHSSTVFYEKLKVVGLLHLVVLSGINITLLGALIGSLTARLGRRISVVITISIIVIFVLFVRPQAPIVRAAVMGILTLVATVYGRQAIALYLVFISALVTLIIWPEWLTTVSFQLSYGATIGIILFGKSSPVTSENGLARMKGAIRNDLKTSLSAQIFTAPLIFAYFKQISLVAPLSNVLVSFTIAPLMIIGFITVILGKIHYALGFIPSLFAYGILTYVIFIIDVLSRIPYTFLTF